MSVAYNYSEFCSHIKDEVRGQVPAVGDLLPDMITYRLSGEQVKFQDTVGRITVLELGSLTCPVFQGRREGMSRLAEKFPEYNFSVLYVREAHPGELVPPHGAIDDKLKWANELKTAFNETRNIFVDDLDGSCHKLLGSMPNSVFILDEHGRILFYSDWNDVGAVERILVDINSGRDIEKIKTFFKPISLRVFGRTVKTAGKGSIRGFIYCWRLFFYNFFVRNIKVVLNNKK